MSADETGSVERVHFASRRVIEAPARRSETTVAELAPTANGAPVRLRRRIHVGRNTVAFVRKAISTEVEFATPFLLTPVFLGAGALLYSSARLEPDWSALVLAAAIAAACIWLTRSRPTARLVLWAVLLTIAGVLAAKVETWRTDTLMLGSAVSTTVNGTISALELQGNNRARVTIDIDSTEKPRLKYAPRRVRLVLRKPPRTLRPGLEIAGKARLLPHAGPVHPQGFDFAFHNYFREIGAVGFFLGQPRVWQAAAHESTLRPAIVLARIRGWLTARIKQRIDGPEGEVAAALIAGAKTGIPEEISEMLRRTGLAHILSISGLHMALVAGTVMAALRFCFAMFPEFASRHAVRKYAAAAALLTVFVYLFISGAGIATQRSFLMLAVMLVALMLDRPAITMRNLAIAAVIIIVLQPHEVAGPSFQMSFAATAALIAVYTAWSARRARAAEAGRNANMSAVGQAAVTMWAHKIRFFVVTLAVTSLVAGAATAIFGVWHFQRLAPLGLFANLAAMPIVSFLVMPSAVIGVMMMPLDLDGPAFAVMGYGIGLVILIADWFSQRSPIDAVGMIPLSSLLWASAGLVAATLPVTALRLLGLPMFAVAALLAAARTPPMIFVDEAGKMIAVRRDEGGLSMNTSKPRDFILQIWKKASGQSVHFGPLQQRTGALTPNSLAANIETFVCSRAACAVQLANGAVVAHAKNANDARAMCRFATVIVLKSATGPPNICPAGDQSDAHRPYVLTARDLARRGAAMISVVANESAMPTAQDPARQSAFLIHIDHAISMPWRPWHAHRAFSREARGLGPIKRSKYKAGRGDR